MFKLLYMLIKWSKNAQKLVKMVLENLLTTPKNRVQTPTTENELRLELTFTMGTNSIVMGTNLVEIRTTCYNYS